MKIGVLTQPLHNNYGGLLQAYALQTVLRSLGHEAVVINRKFPKTGNIRKKLKIIKQLILRYVFNRKNVEIFQFIPRDDQRKVVSRETAVFIDKNIDITEPIFSSNDLRKEIYERGYEAIIVGSDQVWRPKYSPKIENYFLDVLKNNLSVKKVSYAASFGVDQWEFSTSQTKKCKKLCQLFDTVTVREKSGVLLCNKYFSVKATHVLDPTLLLSVKDYKELCRDEVESDGEIFTYLLDNNKEKDLVVDQISSQIGLKAFSVMPKKTLNRNNQEDIEECVFPSVKKWLRGFVDARFVVTDSFHGCVFAIIFNIPFVVVGNHQRGLARFSSLLESFDLSERLIFSREDLSQKLLTEKMDWDLINRRREQMIEGSLEILKNNLP